MTSVNRLRNRRNAAEQRRKQKVSLAADKEEIKALRAQVLRMAAELSECRSRLKAFEQGSEVPASRQVEPEQATEPALEHPHVAYDEEEEIDNQSDTEAGCEGEGDYADFKRRRADEPTE